MTETSPASFMSSVDDPLDKKLQTVGKILPHTSAKVVDRSGKIVPRGVRGEICTAGYLLQKGYFNNPQKTAEVMIQEDGVLWMYTGDEGFIDEEGYCAITGRIKDMIIRGTSPSSPPSTQSLNLSLTRSAQQEAKTSTLPRSKIGSNNTPQFCSPASLG